MKRCINFLVSLLISIALVTSLSSIPTCFAKDIYDHAHLNNLNTHDPIEGKHVHKHHHDGEAGEHEHAHNLKVDLKDFIFLVSLLISLKPIALKAEDGSIVPSLKAHNYLQEILRPPIL